MPFYLKDICLLLVFLSLVSCGIFQKGKETTTLGKDSPAPINLSEQERIRLDRLFIEATSEKMQGNHEKARQMYLQSLKIDPNNAAAYYQISRLSRDMRNLDDAKYYAQKATRLDSSNKWYQKNYAEILKQTNDYEKAAKVYAGLVKDFPYDHELYIDWAYMLIRNEQWEAGIEVMNRLEEQIGLDENIIRQKQKLYMRLGKFDKAVEEARKLIDANPKDPSYYHMLAELYEANDKHEAAMALYEQMLELDPENADARLAMADYYQRQGERKKFFEQLHVVFRNPVVDIDRKVKILFSYFRLLDDQPELLQEAIDLSKILVETHPREAKSYSIYGDFLYQNDQPEAAMEQYRQAVELDNSRFTLWRQMLLIETELERYDNAIKVADEALIYFPNQPLIYYFKSIALLQQKKYPAAINGLEEGLRLNPENETIKAQMYANLGEAHHNEKNYTASDSAYEAALAIDPDNDIVLNNYSYYLSLRRHNLDRAEEMARRANRLSPDNSAFQDTYGWILYQQGDFKEARKWIEKSMDNGGDQRPVILEHYGDVLYQLEEKGKAVEYWKKAREKGSDSKLIDKKIADKKLYE